MRKRVIVLNIILLDYYCHETYNITINLAVNVVKSKVSHISEIKLHSTTEVALLLKMLPFKTRAETRDEYCISPSIIIYYFKQI